MKLFIQSELKEISGQILSVYWTLVKIMVPTLILVRVLAELGVVQWLSVLLGPLMHLVGLPSDMGLVWATALLTNIYTAMAVYFELSASNPMSVAQVSVLASMILVGHALIVEGAIASKAGVRWPVTLLTRLGGALLLGGLLNLSYQLTDSLQQPAKLMWQPKAQAEGWLAWVYQQTETLIAVFFVIAALIITLRMLRLLGIERLMHWLLDPVLRFIGVGKAAANTTVIGITLGLSFGGGLLIQEAKSGVMSKRDILLSMSFLGLCHSLIEDTLLLMLLGAHLSAILWARLVFALLVIALIARLLRRPGGSEILNRALR